MAGKVNPGALAGAAGAGLPCYAIAAGTRNLTPDDRHGNALAARLATFTETLCPEGAGRYAHLLGADMKALRIGRLRARYGLTPSQAALVAALAWGNADG